MPALYALPSDGFTSAPGLNIQARDGQVFTLCNLPRAFP